MGIANSLAQQIDPSQMTDQQYNDLPIVSGPSPDFMMPGQRQGMPIGQSPQMPNVDQIATGRFGPETQAKAADYYGQNQTAPGFERRMPMDPNAPITNYKENY
jgi:hypothetical protein